MNWTTYAEIAIGTGLMMLTGALVYCAKQEVKMKTTDLRERATPRVRAWIGYNWQRSVPTLEVIIANLGEGAAKDVRWWFEDVDEADWENRIELINWPDCEENAASVDFLRSGEEIRITLAMGRDLTAPSGTNINQQKTHYPVKPFTVALRYEALPETSGEGKEEEPVRTSLTPRLAYPANTGAADGLHRIADALERGPGMGISWYGKHPDQGRSASAPRRPDWTEEQEAFRENR